VSLVRAAGRSGAEVLLDDIGTPIGCWLSRLLGLFGCWLGSFMLFLDEEAEPGTSSRGRYQ